MLYLCLFSLKICLQCVVVINDHVHEARGEIALPP